MSGFIEGVGRSQSSLFPDRLEDWVGEDNPVRVIDLFVDDLAFSELGFERTAAARTGRPGYHPGVLLKLFIYGYLNRIPSSRRLEREAGRNVEAMWLTGRLVPDHKTIADFRRDNGPAIRRTCAAFVELCRRMTLIARLRIILNDVDPQPMRHIEVPLKIRLDRLHEVIQAAMAWTDTHLYEFRVGDAGWGVLDPDEFYDGPMDAKKMTLEKLIDQTGTRTIQYVYDFGDDWDHSIRIERVGEAAPGMIYPRLLKAAGACPPEDVGGAWGYEEFLKALADPDHEQHEDIVHWSGEDFDAKDAGADSFIERFERLAKKWAPRPRKPKATI